MKKYFIILLLANSQAGYSQNTETDSLQKLLAVTREDTSRVLLMESISYAYQYSNVERAMQYALQGLELAKKINFKKGKLTVLMPLEIYFLLRGIILKRLKNILKH